MHRASRFLHFLLAGHDPNSPFARPNRQRISIRLLRCAVYCQYLQKHSRCEASNHGNHVQNGPVHDLHKRNRSGDKLRVHVSSSEIVRINDANIRHFWEITAHTLQESCNHSHRVPPNATCCSIFLPFQHKNLGCPPLIAYAQSDLTTNRSTLPNDRHKDLTFSPSGSAFSPPSWRYSPQLRDFLSKLPCYFRKTERNSKKVPHFLFHLSRHTLEAAKKNRKYPTNS